MIGSPDAISEVVSIGGLGDEQGACRVATIAAILGTATAASAQTAIASDESPFRFQFEQARALAAWRSRATSTTHFMAHHQRSGAG